MTLPTKIYAKVSGTWQMASKLNERHCSFCSLRRECREVRGFNAFCLYDGWAWGVFRPPTRRDVLGDILEVEK